MLDPITNQIANHAARRATDARRPLDKRARASEKGERDDSVDSFDHRLAGVEQASASRPLADAAGEESRIERRSHEIGPASDGDGPDGADGSRPIRDDRGVGEARTQSGKRPPADPGNTPRLDLTA